MMHDYDVTGAAVARFLLGPTADADGNVRIADGLVPLDEVTFTDMVDDIAYVSIRTGHDFTAAVAAVERLRAGFEARRQAGDLP